MLTQQENVEIHALMEEGLVVLGNRPALLSTTAKSARWTSRGRTAACALDHFLPTEETPPAHLWFFDKNQKLTFRFNANHAPLGARSKTFVVFLADFTQEGANGHAVSPP